MGAPCMIGLGLALAQPKKQVLVVTGDGDLLMNVGRARHHRGDEPAQSRDRLRRQRPLRRDRLAEEPYQPRRRPREDRDRLRHQAHHDGRAGGRPRARRRASSARATARASCCCASSRPSRRTSSAISTPPSAATGSGGRCRRRRPMSPARESAASIARPSEPWMWAALSRRASGRPYADARFGMTMSSTMNFDFTEEQKLFAEVRAQVRAGASRQGRAQARARSALSLRRGQADERAGAHGHHHRRRRTAASAAR